MDGLPKRRHERLLLALALIIGLLVGFWLGRMTAADSLVAYERGRREGQATEQQRIEQSKIDLDILQGEVAASRQDQLEKSSAAEGSIDPTPGTASGASK